MDGVEVNELKRWAVVHVKQGMVQARQVLELFAELNRLRRLNEGLCERVATQSQLLSRKAERVIDHVDMELSGAGLVVGDMGDADE